MHMELNLHQLYLFLSVAKTGSISRAADELGISQPSVSAQVREFELRCGVDLLHRLPRGVTLTAAGKMVRDHAEGIFERSDQLQFALRNLREPIIHGTLTVGGSL